MRDVILFSNGKLYKKVKHHSFFLDLLDFRSRDL